MTAPTTTILTTGPVLVAVDGSTESLAALDWAQHYATLNDLNLHIVTAADPTLCKGSGSAGGYDRAVKRVEATTRFRVRQAIEQHFANRSVTYEHHVVVGSIDNVLQTHSRNAHLAVVGTRKQGRFKRLLRSSTTDRLTGSLYCPIVSVPIGGLVTQTLDTVSPGRLERIPADHRSLQAA
jgi:nucleotide-binding universal stress UspA family protein